MTTFNQDDEEGVSEQQAGESEEFSNPFDDSSAAASEITFTDDAFADLYRPNPELDLSDPTPCAYLTGPAGSGKTYEILRRCEEDEFYAILSASTGIAAVNLNTTTIHSLLGFFDYDSLRDAYLRGTAQSKLRAIAAEGYRNVVIDEISMISHQVLDMLVQIFDQVNEKTISKGNLPIGIILVGDAMQLPSIPEGRGKSRGPTPWFFEARNWDRFERNTTRLTKIWRQSDRTFLDALNHARAGRGAACAEMLERAGAEFHTAVEIEFDGTTILAENKQVDAFNMEALKKVKGRDMFLPARRWGRERGEWKNIPVQTHVREGAYVMILANQPGDRRGEFTYVNGDCGHVRGITQRPGLMPQINVELVRTGQIVKVSTVVRGVEERERPVGWAGKDKVIEDYFPELHHSANKKRYVSGQVQYYPIRLAYGTTVHKAQGLTLDRVQVDLRTWQFSKPAMVYIALSRCRSLGGLRIVGQKEVLAQKCQADPKVLKYL